MKKIITSLFCILTINLTINAKIVYVAASGDNSDGSSWAKALTNIPTNSSGAITAGDSVFVKSGTYSLSQTTASSSCLATKADVNYLGGFSGNESNSAQRAMADLDSNGIIEPWEFSNASTLSFNATNNAYGLYISSNTSKRLFEGFTITGTLNVGQLSGSTGGNNMVKLNNYTLFRYNTLSGCTLSATPNTATANMGYTKGALLFIGQPTTTTGGSNTVDNCLIENNSSAVTPTSTQTQDVQQSPLIHIDASNTTGRNVLSNCVFRKNQITLDYTNFTGTTYNNQRGMLISMSIYGSAALIGQYNCVKNLLIYNNTATFTPKTGAAATTNLGNGGLIYTYNTAQNTYDSILNCTIVNNSMMRIGHGIKAGFSNTTQPYHVIANNVMLNNNNDNGAGTITTQNMLINQTPATTGTGILIANNVGNGGFAFSAVANTVVNNLTDLSTTNTNATKGAWFASPTSVIGYSTDASVATSRWTIGSGSYLKAKGYTLPNSPSGLAQTDKAGHSFAATPATGAYENFICNISTNINEPATSTSTVTGSGTVDYGSSVTVSATPHQGKVFVNWTDASGIISSNSSYSFIATKDYAVTANFEIDPSTNISSLISSVYKIENRQITLTSNVDVDVFNLTGKKIISLSGIGKKANLSEGIYLLRINKGHEAVKVFVL